MRFRLYDNDITNLIIKKDSSNTFFIEDGDIKECVTQLKHPLGGGYYHEIYFENVHIGFGNVSLSDRVFFHFESDLETVEMHFALKGKGTATTQDFPNQFCFERYQHNIVYATRLQGKMELDCGEFQLLEINLSPAFFKRFLPEESIVLDRFRNTIDKQYTNLLNPNHSRISHQMYHILNEIMHCNRKGFFKKMFLEAKVIELLSLQLEQFCDYSFANTSVSKTDIEKMYAVREYIVENLNKYCSLIDLARLVGTNEFSLKKGFKELFGTTVFGFWNDTKMEQARKMLTEQEMNMTEISDSLGFKNPRYFSTAFKRKYGILPGQLKK